MSDTAPRDTLTILQSSRRMLPLRVQMLYGTCKRRLVHHTLWDDPEFVQLHEWLKVTEWWSEEELKAYQLAELRALIRHAYENVPYYRRIFDERALTPIDIKTLDDLQKLPITTKSDVSENPDRFLPRGIEKSNLRLETTGGSTNTPMPLYHDPKTVFIRENAFVIRQWSWAGYRRGDRIVEIRGSFVPKNGSSGDSTWWGYDPADNKLMLSAFDMSEVNLPKYVEKIRAFSPEYISATPSSLRLLVGFLARNPNSCIRVRSVFCESETLPSWLRRLTEDELGCRIYAGYGMTERVADAIECDHHEGYHLNMEYGILELVDEEQNPITEPGRTGKVIGTGLDTYYMPLIRYETDDLASYSPNSCSCGRQSTLIDDFKGRVQEFVVLANGQIASIHAAIAGHAAVWIGIRELRFIQNQPGELIAELVPVKWSSQTEIENEFKRDFHTRIPENEMHLSVTFVSDIPRTHRAKTPLLVQRLPIEEIARINRFEL